MFDAHESPLARSTRLFKRGAKAFVAMMRPEFGLPQHVLIAFVQLYRWTLKPWLGNACRFEPSCSQYALDALSQQGALVGASLSAWRLLRCHPWCDGGCDPAPSQPLRLFARLGLGAVSPTEASTEPKLRSSTFSSTLSSSRQVPP